MAGKGAEDKDLSRLFLRVSFSLIYIVDLFLGQWFITLVFAGDAEFAPRVRNRRRIGWGGDWWSDAWYRKSRASVWRLWSCPQSELKFQTNHATVFNRTTDNKIILQKEIKSFRALSRVNCFLEIAKSSSNQDRVPFPANGRLICAPVRVFGYWRHTCKCNCNNDRNKMSKQMYPVLQDVRLL